MARPKPNPEERTTGRRGSPEVVEKRRAARLFNDILLGRKAGAGDGRSERRRRRMLEELARGKVRGGKRELTPIDVLSRVQALLELGESVASIRRARPVPPAAPLTPALVEGVQRLHRAYGFPLEAYRFVGIGGSVLREAGLDADSRPGGPALAHTRPGARARGPARGGPAKAGGRRRASGRGAA